MMSSSLLAVLLLAFLGALLAPVSATATGADRVPVVELPLTQAQVNANLARAVEDLRQQLDAAQEVLKVANRDAKFVKSQMAVANLTSAANCTNDLNCVRTAINTLDDYIMQLYAIRLSYAVQAGEIKYAAGQDVLDPSRESVVLANAEANALANGLPSYVGSVMYGNYCMLYVSKRMEVEDLNGSYGANLPMPVQHADS